ncbi:T9SS type A sorting domain-containing protein [Flavobacterium sp. RS13.1]|uniref:T9SS type A sorting domain-containing protein n=1 Tax=Flavobacterium sp. RS13.1 TaxID=3400345 RepID=UPI003AAE0B93
MKRKLLYLTTTMLFSVLSINAQTTIWDLGNNSSVLNGGAPVTTDWPVAAAFAAGTVTVKSNLAIFPGTATTYGNIVAQTATNPFPSDGYTFVNRFQTGGSSVAASGDALPTSRYNYFNVSGACTVKVWFRGGNSNETRSMFVSNGTTVYGSAAAVNGAYVIFTANVTAAGKIYIYGDAGNNLYKIEVSGATVTAPALAVDDFHADAASNVYSNGKLVFVSNVKSDTQVDVYGVSGILVKSLKTASDTSFNLNNGLYIVKSKSAEGEKTAKVLVN